MVNVTNDWHSGDADTLPAAFARVVADRPQHGFLDFSGEQYSYGEFDRLTNRLAHGLAALGVRAGDTVVTMLDNNVDAVAAWFAVNKLGAISVPLNTALRGEFLRHQVCDAGSALVICEADYLPRFAEIAAALPQVRLILHRGAATGAPSCPITVAPLDAHRGTDESPTGVIVAPGDLTCIIYTSGTTGPSKGSMQSYNYLCNLARTRLRFCPAGPADITFTPLPLFHNNALATGVTATVLSGGRIAIAPRFSVSGFWPEVERSGATVASLVGTMAMLLADAPDDEAAKRCYGRIHTVRGVPFSDAVKAAWRTRFGARFVGSNDYGMTEVAVITGLPGGAHAPPGSSGQRIADFDVRIFDDEDREVPAGTPGEIVVRPNKPDIMFKGYWRRPEATVAAMRNQWFHTGDIGRFDGDGFLYFLDRKKDYLKRRGENISSFEMETTFKQHPAIAEVAVHAVPAKIGEDDVKVTAVLKAGESLSEEALCRWAIERVPYFAVPRYIEFRDSLPQNTQGKVLKYQLRDEGATPRTWDIETSDIKVTKR